MATQQSVVVASGKTVELPCLQEMWREYRKEVREREEQRGRREVCGEVLGKESANKSLIYAHIVAHKPNIYFLIHLCQCDLPNVLAALALDSSKRQRGQDGVRVRKRERGIVRLIRAIKPKGN